MFNRSEFDGGELGKGEFGRGEYDGGEFGEWVSLVLEPYRMAGIWLKNG